MWTRSLAVTKSQASRVASTPTWLSIPPSTSPWAGGQSCTHEEADAVQGEASGGLGEGREGLRQLRPQLPAGGHEDGQGEPLAEPLHRPSFQHQLTRPSRLSSRWKEGGRMGTAALAQARAWMAGAPRTPARMKRRVKVSFIQAMSCPCVQLNWQMT